MQNPPPNPSQNPPTMRVAVEVGYVQTCPECLAIAMGLASSCIGDKTVTSFRSIPGRRHAHEVTEGSQALPGLAESSGQATGPQPAPPAQVAHYDEYDLLPISDTNGSDPEAVARHLATLL